MSREDLISEWIKERLDYGEEPTQCIFQITVPEFFLDKRLETDENIRILTDIFDKYGISWQVGDTVDGAFVLDRNWVETSDIPCYIEYSGVYPVEWDIKDIATLERLEYEGKVVIKVMWHLEDEEFVPNH